MFDFAIIGAGISGASIAYFLNKLGKKVVVIDKGSVASGGSGASGAFLSPKICSNSRYSAFINESFLYSINFYRENFPEFLKQNEITHLKRDSCEFGGYFFEDGALIDSVGVIKSMLKDIHVEENVHVKSLSFKDGVYQIGHIKAKGVILCAGSSDEFEEVNYCKLKKIYGHRYEDEINSMLELAKSYVDLKDYEIEKIHFGVRSSTTDFFPVLGTVINVKETLRKYPYIKKGSLVPKKNISFI